MPTPIYNQDEIGEMVTMPKRIAHDDWRSSHGLRGGDDGRGQRFKVVPVDAATRAGFTVATERRSEKDEFSITLLGSLRMRPEERICRYDIQNIGHGSPPICGGLPYIGARRPHRHVHCVAAVRSGTLRDWDVCAELLPIDAGGLFTHVVDRLIRQFMEDVSLNVEDQDTFDQLFRRP